MRTEPVVSIIVNNYNYGRFLTEAIESALNQSYSNLEVIVVDDGSTDNSLQLIAGYDQRIVPVLKENGGQASAFNAGFVHSRGEIIIFLDADDILLPDTVWRVVEIFQANPSIARVQYRLEITDAVGNRTGSVVPPLYLPLPTGDLRENIPALVNCASWSPTSGNAFAAWTLRQILPMPEAAFQRCADYYLVRANALCGPIISLDKVGAYYRSHGANSFLASTINLIQLRQQILLARTTHEALRSFAKSLGLDQYPVTDEVLDEMFLAQRMISLKLEPALHPMQEDTLFSLFWRGAKASWQRANLAFWVKLLHMLWFAALNLAPRSLAIWLAEKFLPETRSSLNRVLNLMQAGQKRAVVLGKGQPLV